MLSITYISSKVITLQQLQVGRVKSYVEVPCIIQKFISHQTQFGFTNTWLEMHCLRVIIISFYPKGLCKSKIVTTMLALLLQRILTAMITTLPRCLKFCRLEIMVVSCFENSKVHICNCAPQVLAKHTA